MDGVRGRIGALTVAALLGALAVVGGVDGDVATAEPIEDAVYLSVAERPSHHGRYRAELVPAPGPVARSRSLAWTLQVRTAGGRPVRDAELVLEAWMPEEELVDARTLAATSLGNGRYRVTGLRFERPGWWNLRLAITGPSGTDSLAFNLIL